MMKDPTDGRAPGDDHHGSLAARLQREFPRLLLADIDAVLMAVGKLLPHADTETVLATSREWLEVD